MGIAHRTRQLAKGKGELEVLMAKKQQEDGQNKALKKQMEKDEYNLKWSKRRSNSVLQDEVKAKADVDKGKNAIASEKKSIQSDKAKEMQVEAKLSETEDTNTVLQGKLAKADVKEAELSASMKSTQ